MERCANTEALNKHLAEQEESQHEDDYLEEKIQEVKNEFLDIADSDGLDKACKYLCGAYEDELATNIAAIIIGDCEESEYIDDAFTAKAKQLIQAEQDER